MATAIDKASNPARGYPIALVSAVILSTTGIFIRYLTQAYHMPALLLAFWRDFLVTLTLLLILAMFKPRLLILERRNWFYFLGYGAVLALFNALWTLAVSLNGAAIATVLVYSSAAFTALLGRWLLGEPLGWGKVAAILLCLLGCVLVSGALRPDRWTGNTLGILTGLFSGLGFATYTLMGRSASQRGLNTWTTLLYTFASASAILLAVNLLPGNQVLENATYPIDLFWLGAALDGWLILFALAAGPTLAGFGLYNLSLSYLPSSVVNIILTLEPVFTSLLAYFLLGELLSGTQIFGAAMILTGVLLLRTSRRGTSNR
jgi:drug/metabolite transporter (DMT)-like permease